MADKDFTAQEKVTPEQLEKQYPYNENPFGVWYCADAEHYKWAVNDENGDGFTNTTPYKTALILSEALRIRHEIKNNGGLLLDNEQQEEITKALLIGLGSFGEIKRINDEVGKYELVPSMGKLPESIRPTHPTGANDTIGVFADALRFMQQV